MNEFKQWFLDLSPRDQIMMVAGAGIVVVYILLFLILFPMQNSLERARKQNVASLTEQQTVRELAGRVLAMKQAASGSGNKQSLNSVVNKSLAEHSLTMESFQPSGNSARVRLATSDFNNVFSWLHDLEMKHGISIKDLTVTADSSPGSVMVNAQLLWGQ